MLNKTPQKGFWWNQGVVWRDDIAILEVDIRDTQEDRHRLKTYAQETLLERFDQKSIYIKLVCIVEILEIHIDDADE